MSRTLSPSTARRYGVRMVTQEWQISRSAVYAARARTLAAGPWLKRGPKTPLADDELTGGRRRDCRTFGRLARPKSSALPRSAA
jgi:putative transposase